MKYVLTLLLLASSQVSFAFRLDPMSATIELKDNQTYLNFVIENESTQPLPVQISLFERQIKDNGEDELKETNEIIAFPDQLIIPAEQKRSVKVSWSGNTKDIKSEKAFRFVAEQLPVNLKKNKDQKSGIKMLLKYVAALYVNPKDTEAKVNCQLSGTNLICENTGNKHQILTFKSLVLDDGGKKVDFNKEELRKISGENLLPDGKRTLKLDFRNEVKALKSPAKVNLKFE